MMQVKGKRLDRTFKDQSMSFLNQIVTHFASIIERMEVCLVCQASGFGNPPLIDR